MSLPYDSLEACGSDQKELISLETYKLAKNSNSTLIWAALALAYR